MSQGYGKPGDPYIGRKGRRAMFAGFRSRAFKQPKGPAKRMPYRMYLTMKRMMASLTKERPK